MRRSSSEVLTRLTTIALLSALGFVLMAFVRFSYPLAPWLQIEISDTVVLIAYALYGFPGGAAVALIKTALDMAIHGLTGIYGIGNITALLTSLTFALGLFLTSHAFKLFKKGLGFRILGYTIITLLVAVIMTGLNALFITPTYLDGSKFVTCFNSDAVAGVVNALKGMLKVETNSYFLIIFIAYFPFNILKGMIVCAIYEILFNRLIFVLMQRSPKMKKYFLGPIFTNKNATHKEILLNDIEPKEKVENKEETNEK